MSLAFQWHIGNLNRSTRLRNRSLQSSSNLTNFFIPSVWVFSDPKSSKSIQTLLARNYMSLAFQWHLGSLNRSTRLGEIYIQKMLIFEFQLPATPVTKGKKIKGRRFCRFWTPTKLTSNKKNWLKIRPILVGCFSKESLPLFLG